MDVKIESSWKKRLQNQFESDYFAELSEFVKSEYQTKTVYPPGKQIFAAFDFCPFEDVKVVIIGQDPYHGPGQANGLCFSVSDGIPFPPSLKNIFTELASDIGVDIPTSGNLERWAKQGVLLLNATLTVEQGNAGSHQRKGWEKFTDAVISELNANRSELVFLLWGGFAKSKAKLLDKNKHHILLSGHPSPLSANKGHWFGNKHFSQCNHYLKSIGQKPIDW